IDLARQRRGDLKEGRLDAPPLAVEPSQLSGRRPGDRHIGEDMQFAVPVASQLLEPNRDATHPQRLTAVGVAHEHRLFVDRAAAARAPAGGTPKAVALY